MPDFFVQLANGKTLVLEIKGVDDDRNRAKRSALEMWVKGVNQRGDFGTWAADVAFEPWQIRASVERHAGRMG